MKEFAFEKKKKKRDSNGSTLDYYMNQSCARRQLRIFIQDFGSTLCTPNDAARQPFWGNLPQASLLSTHLGDMEIAFISNLLTHVDGKLFQ